MSYMDHLGEILDERYRLVRKLAEGGMGAVYMAEHIDIGGQLAVKLLRPELVANVQFLRRFKREARANAAIHHRNIVKIFDTGVAPWGEPYMVMEYLEGESLKSLIGRSGPLSLALAVHIVRQALEGLFATHEAGIVHRDLKPDNLILVYEGSDLPTVKIIDFGISKFVPEQGAEITWSGIVLGTARYMSPEQAEGSSDVDHRSDLYSMGVVLYHALTGAFPHAAPSHGETLAESLQRPPRPPSDHCQGFPEDVGRFLMKALARNPVKRFRNASEMADALDELKLVGECVRGRVPAGREEDMATVAADSGALGETVLAGPAAKKVAPRSMPAPIRRSEVGEWVGEDGGGSRRQGKMPAIALVVSAVLFGAVVLYWTGALADLVSGEDRRATSTMANPASAAPGPETAPPEEPEGMMITVDGAPESSRVYWDDTQVPMNPFRVERRETIVPLRVEADGYESFSIAVLPDEDQTVHVAMVPSNAAAKRKVGKHHGTLQHRGTASTGKNHALVQQQSVIARNKHGLKRCYDKALERGDAPPDEDLLVHFRLGLKSNGLVGDVDLTGNGASVPSFAGCLDKELRSWFFLPTTGKETVSFSFAFTTSG